MSIIDSINKAKQKGVSDDIILEEVIKQNPDKKAALEEALKRGASHSHILEEIIKQNSEKKSIEQEEKKKEVQELIMQKLGGNQKKEEFEEKREEADSLPPKKTQADKQWKRLTVFLLLILSVAAFATFWFWFLMIRPQAPIPPHEDPSYYTTQEECEKVGYYWDRDACYKEERKAIDYITKYECEESGYYWYYSICHEEDLKLTLEESINLISDTLSQEFSKGEFHEILFRIERDEISFEKIIQGLEIKFSELFDQLKDPIFFVYSQEQGNRIGFYGETKEDLTNLIKEREEDLLEIFANLFLAIQDKEEVIQENEEMEEQDILEEETTEQEIEEETTEQTVEEEEEIIVLEFKDALNYDGPNFRYLILEEENDLGIFYYVSKNDFVFSTSRESMEKLIKDIIMVKKEQTIISTTEEIVDIIENIFEETESYETICQNENITEKLEYISAETGQAPVCVSLQDRYCISVESFFELNDYCIDVTGKKGHVGPCLNYYCSN